MKNLCEDFSVTSRRWVETSRRFNVATFQRHDVNFTLLWNVATWISNVATLFFNSLERRDVDFQRCDVVFFNSLEHRDVDFQRRDVDFSTL